MATKSLLWMIYGGAFRLYVQVYSKFGIKIKFVDTTNPENVQNAITPNTKLIWFESPTNPLLKISDIEQICKIAKENNVLVCVIILLLRHFSKDYFLQIYLRYPTVLEVSIDLFDELFEKYDSNSLRYVTGSIKYSNLLSSGWLNNPNVGIVIIKTNGEI